MSSSFQSGVIYTVSQEKLFIPTSRFAVSPGDRFLLVLSPRYTEYYRGQQAFRMADEEFWHEFWIQPKYWDYIIPWKVK